MQTDLTNNGLFYRSVPSPVGDWLVVASDKGVRAVLSPRSRVLNEWLAQSHAGEHPILEDAAQQLSKYFEGQLREFSVPLDLQGTPFQLQCWRELQNIPYGSTISYGEQARRMKNPQAVRAVGAANGQNLVSIIVPCHRVLASNGQLQGFAGGLECKRWLLDFEREQAVQSTLFGS